jgi:hypothetical protein
MSQAWTVKDGEGRVLPCFTAASRRDVERKLVLNRYDAFRLHVSSSYREMFARDLAKVFARNQWRVVRTRTKIPSKAGNGTDAQLELKLN